MANAKYSALRAPIKNAFATCIYSAFILGAVISSRSHLEYVSLKCLLFHLERLLGHVPFNPTFVLYKYIIVVKD